MRTLVLSVINLRLPEPHEPQRYIKAMRQAFAQRRVVKIRTVSTADHPLEDRVTYDPNTELRQAVFLDRARALLVRLGLLRG